MVGYRLKNTVSDNGTVSRGVCQLDSGSLRKVKETLKIKKYPDGRITDTENPAQEVPLDPESVVSMNFWGFTPGFLRRWRPISTPSSGNWHRRSRRRNACCRCWWTA